MIMFDGLGMDDDGRLYKTHSISPCGKRLHSVRKKRPQAALQRASRKKNRGVK